MNSQQLLPRSSPGQQARVFVKTLGVVVVSVAGAAAVWKGGGAGPRQLRRVFSYLVAHRDRAVHREDLRVVAGGQVSRRRHYVLSGFRAMLKSWGMDGALKRDGPLVILKQHPSWRTDTDDLMESLNAALALEHAGSRMEAIALLEYATNNCGGTFLADYDGPPKLLIDRQVDHWNIVQKQVFQLLCRLCLTLSERSFHRRGLSAAESAIRLGRQNADDNDLAADAAERCELWTMAAYYRDRARRLRSALRFQQ
jgi:hypothetical protein